MFSHQGLKQSSNGGGGDDNKSLKRKMNRGEQKQKAAKSAAASGKSKMGKGSRPRRVDDFSGLNLDERPPGGGAGEHIADKRFFDGKHYYECRGMLCSFVAL